MNLSLLSLKTHRACRGIDARFSVVALSLSRGVVWKLEKEYASSGVARPWLKIVISVTNNPQIAFTEWPRKGRPPTINIVHRLVCPFRCDHDRTTSARSITPVQVQLREIEHKTDDNERINLLRRDVLEFPFTGPWNHLILLSVSEFPQQNGPFKCNANLKGEKDFNDNHRKKLNDFVQSIPGFQECDEDDVETGMACDEEDCGFQMLNDDEIVTSVQEESNPVDDETDEDEDNSNESSKGSSNAMAFSALDSYGGVRTTIRGLSYSTTAAQENQRPCSEKTKMYNGTAKNK
ncbi:uncharacterized protein TNCV_2016961 [Trichonephila clavipes]|nr:uncharacterized protein TNCV_2016961 [Trichonephila clavipes]